MSCNFVRAARVTGEDDWYLTLQVTKAELTEVVTYDGEPVLQVVFVCLGGTDLEPCLPWEA